MIRLPQRSVTRFFIPLIDVLTLLFCIFLVLPLARAPGEQTAEDLRRLEQERRRLQQQLDEARRNGEEAPRDLQEQMERLRREQAKALQERLAVRVLEIDGRTGKLYYLDPERVEVRDEADAHALIDRDRRERGLGGRELYYLILYPRDRASSYPTRGQQAQYDRWFRGVAHGYDVPGAGPQGEKQP
jgi:hypothetical protein